MVRRTTLTLAVTLLAASWLAAGAAAPARALTPDAQMHEAVMALRALIDRDGVTRYFKYPFKSNVRPGYLGGSWWPRDPWSGKPLRAGTARGQFEYEVSADRRHYRLVGHLSNGALVVVGGGMPRTIMRAYDHRGEEGIHLIRQYIEDNAGLHKGVYPLPAEVAADGAVGSKPRHHYWPSNPWDHMDMRQRGDTGSFEYSVAADRLSYTLRLHRALKADYVLTGTSAGGTWQQVFTTLHDEILRRSGRILAGYVGQWSLQHGGSLPTVSEFRPDGAVGAAHTDWPHDLTGSSALHPGAAPGAYTYLPGAGGAYTLTVHLHSGDFEAGGTAPSLAGPVRGSGSPGS